MPTPTPAQRIYRLILFFFFLVFVGVVGYILIEGLSPLDALYMTIITISTVGFQEVRPLSANGRLFTMTLVLLGVGAGAYTFGTIAEFLVAGELAGTLKRRKLMRAIERLQGHYVICGYGRIGEQVARGLVDEGIPCVIVDQASEAIQRCEQCGILYVMGDATEDETLLRAGIQRARGLVAVLDNDAENVFVVLSARSLNPNLTIIARATTREAEVKLRKAGADGVLSPYQLAAHRIVRELTRPHVMIFLEKAMGNDPELYMEEIRIHPSSELVGKTLGEAKLRTRTGANVLSILRGADQRVIDWAPDLTLQAEDVMVVLGRPEQVEALARLAGDERFLLRSTRRRGGRNP